MNEQIPEQNNPVPPNVEIAKTGLKKAVSQVKERILPVIKAPLSKLRESKLYKNKLIFWTITSLFGILFLVLILGLLFGKRSKTETTIKASPTPQSTTQPITQGDGPLFQIDQKLKDLKTQITNLDVKQSRLRAPTVNFDVKF